MNIEENLPAIDSDTKFPIIIRVNGEYGYEIKEAQTSDMNESQREIRHKQKFYTCCLVGLGDKSYTRIYTPQYKLAQDVLTEEELHKKFMKLKKKSE